MSLKNPRNTRVLRKQLRNDMTIAEKMLWEKVRKKSLGVRVKRLYGIGPYVLDFYIPQINLAIEVDGGIHLNPEVIIKDVNKDAFLNRNGIRVVRFKNEAILNNMEEVLFRLKNLIENEPD
ncbi:MAG: endonuclease domain-containing protein [Balneolaceae bacterium]